MVESPHNNSLTDSPTGPGIYLNVETSVPCSLLGFLCIRSLKELPSSLLLTEVLHLHRSVLKLNAIFIPTFVPRNEELQDCGLHVASNLESAQQTGNPYSTKCKAVFSLGSENTVRWY